MRTRPETLVWPALVLTAAMAVAACGRASAGAGKGTTSVHATVTVGTARATATAALLPPAPLIWVPATLPPGNPMLGLGTLGVLDIAPSDGNTAYTCTTSAPASPQLNIWVTHDRALHWQPTAALPPVPQHDHMTFCWVIVDAVNPAIAVVTLSWAQMGVGPLPGSCGTFVTFDGGASWQLVSGPQPFTLSWLATYDGSTLAMLDTTVGGGTSALWISRDHMQSWQRTTAPPNALKVLAINPTSGDLLALDQTSASTATLEESHDGGQSWTQHPTSLDPLSLIVSPIVSPPVAQQPWRICGQTPDPNDPLNGGMLLCSMDGGQTWNQRPRLVTTFTNPSKGQFKQTANEFSVAPDGTILAAMPAIPFSSIPATLYRLTPTAQQWQSLGPVPGDAVTTTVLAGAGILWEAQLNTGATVAGLFP